MNHALIFSELHSSIDKYQPDMQEQQVTQGDIVKGFLINDKSMSSENLSDKLRSLANTVSDDAGAIYNVHLSLVITKTMEEQKWSLNLLS